MYTLYSKRIKDAAGAPDIYVYDVFPPAFRNQTFYVLSDILYLCEHNGVSDPWKVLHNSFARELGVKTLGSIHHPACSNIESYVENSSDEAFLDFLDFAFDFVSKMRRISFRYTYCEEQQKKITEAFAEMNFRFKQHSLGYEFINDKLIRKDSEFMHREIIKPALKLLFENDFKGAEQEFFDAFEHRRKGENKDAILDALKAFESTMKTICDGMGYTYNPAQSTAKELIGILESNSFYPTYMNAHITSLRTSLESGLPTMRNKNGGHGQGATVVNVSDEFTEYALNLASTNIVLLAKIYASKKAGGVQ